MRTMQLAGGRSMLSVVLPNYNHARLLPQSLGALLSQTCPPDELIIVDDASTDDSVAVIIRLIAGCPYARLIRNTENCGALVSGQRGIVEARGDLLYFAASDDEVSPRLFEVARDLLGAWPQAAFFSSASAIIDEEGRPLPPQAVVQPLNQPGYVAPELVARVLMRHDSWFMGNTAIYRRALLERAGGFPVSLGAYTDGYMMRYLALKHGVCYSPEMLGCCRVSNGSLSWAATSDLARARSLIAAAAACIAAHPEVFPAGYLQRWNRRCLFAAYALNASTRFPGGGLPTRLFRMLYKIALFVVMRPGDIPSVVMRHFARWCRCRNDGVDDR